jgi:hypothetical protein
MTPSQSLDLTLGPFAAAPLGGQPRAHLVGLLLQRAHARPQLTLGSSSHRALAGRDSFGFGQLSLDAPQAAGELARVLFGAANAAIQRVSLPPQRVLGLGGLPSSLGFQQLGELQCPFLRLPQALPKRRHVALQRSDGRLCRLGAAAERGVVRLARPSRSPLGQEVALALSTLPVDKPASQQSRGRRRRGPRSGRAARRLSSPRTRRLAFLSHRDPLNLRGRSDGSECSGPEA